MSGNRAIRVAATGARVLTGVVVAAACVAGVVAAVAAPWPGITHAPAQAEVAPMPGDTVLVCTGDFRALGRDTSRPLEMESAGSPQLTSGASGEEPEVGSLRVDGLDGAGQVRRLTGTVEGRTAPLIGATESITLAVDDLSGFASAPCREASTESWLVGGSVQTGATDLIVLSNPGAVTATVTLTVYGAERRSSTAIVPAEAQIALPLTSIASGAEAPVIKVTATGSPVRAVLQSSLTRLLDPVGIDLQDAVGAPQRHPVIPGVRYHEEEGDSPSAAIVRLLSPETDTGALIRVREPGGTTDLTTFRVDLVAGEPLEVALSDLAPGMYTVLVDADEPVLAAVREESGAGPGSDFAWATPAPEFDGEALVAVPAGPDAGLYLTNDEDADVTVSLEPLSGSGGAQDLTVPAGTSVEVDVANRTVYSVTATGRVHAAVAMSGDGALSVWPVWPPSGAGTSIVVYP